jgi:hypothetical protein
MCVRVTEKERKSEYVREGEREAKRDRDSEKKMGTGIVHRRV